MAAPVDYSKDYCDEVQRRIDGDVSHLVEKIDNLRQDFKSLNNRLWIGLIGIVINVIISILVKGAF